MNYFYLQTKPELLSCYSFLYFCRRFSKLVSLDGVYVINGGINERMSEKWRRALVHTGRRKLVTSNNIRIKMSWLYNQPDALIITNLFCYKTLYVSGIFSAHHQEFTTVHSTLVSFMQVFDDRLKAGSVWNSAWKRSSKTCMKLTIVECTVENSWWWAGKEHSKFG